MKRSDISDLMVCQAVAAYRSAGCTPPRPVAILMEMTGAPAKVCMRAIDRAIERGLIDWGVNPYIGWLTEAGEALFSEGAG